MKNITGKLAALLISTATLLHAGPNFIANGNMETAVDGFAKDWSKSEFAEYLEEGGNHFLRLNSGGTSKMPMFYKQINIAKDAKAFKFTARVRYDKVKQGKEKWHDARIIMDFKDADGKKLPGGKAPAFKGTSKGEWREIKFGMPIPEGAKILEIMPCQFNTAEGVLDLDDLVLEVIPLEEAAFVDYKRCEPMPISPEYKLDELMVKGNRLVSKKTGKEVWLQGVALCSMEWSAGGEHIMESVEVCTKQWNANVIRLAVAAKFWFGVGPWQNDKGVKYRALVDNVVDTCQKRGVYVVIDLHEYRAPTQNHADFWLDVSTRYRNHPGVIFGLLNEPHGISWEVWRDGGWVSDKPKQKEGVFSENTEAVRKFHSIGTQKLVEIIRKNGARNLLSAGALDWAYDLSGILKGFALTDTPQGNGIMYETHVYPWKRGWQKSFLDAAEKYPILVGEVGCQPDRMPFIPESAWEGPETWYADMLGIMQKYRLNWTAWCFHPKSSPCLLKNWNYEPTEYWGVHAKDALNGKQFENKKLR